MCKYSAGKGAALGARDLSPVDPSHELVSLQGLDHRGQPPPVERHGVLHDKGDVPAPGEGDTQVARHAVAELGAGDPVYRCAVAPGQLDRTVEPESITSTSYSKCVS